MTTIESRKEINYSKIDLTALNLESKTIRLRFIEKSDAKFVLALRLDERYNQFLSPVSANVKAQEIWIEKYKTDEAQGKEYYFIIETKTKIPCGTVRIYDFRSSSFCWGSWILNEDKTRYSAIESAFLVYEFGFQKLGFEKSHFDVMKGNEKVLSFHKKMGAQQTGEDELNIYFEITREAVEAARHKHLNKIL